jgi:arylsulfatase A-like enzyme
MSGLNGNARDAMRPKAHVIFYLATFFGLVAGLGQVAIFAFEKIVLYHYIHQNPRIVWMTPLVNVLFFWLCALFFWLVAHRWPRLMPRWLMVFAFTFLFYLSLLVMATWLQWIALLVLATGLAVETTRLIRDHPKSFCLLLRYSVGWVGLLPTPPKRKERQALATAPASDSQLTRRQFLLSIGVTLAGLTLGSSGRYVLGEVLALTELPPSPRHALNVLLIVLDTVRAQSMSLYGYARGTTPNLDRLAKAGMLFERALATASWTLPSHSSLFTGRYPHELSADRKTPLDSTYPTLAEVLSEQGYVTAGFVANIEYCSSESGLGRGFINYHDYSVSPGNFALAWSLGNFASLRPKVRQLVNNWNYLGRKSASEVNAEFLRWLDHASSRPFFVFLNYFDAHSPYYPPQFFDGMFGPTTPRDSPIAEKWAHKKDIPSEVLQAEINAYDGTIAYIDHEVGLLYGELGKRGVLENTLVIIASDHGEEFGEHDVFSHGQSLYLPSLHVPLLILYPGQVPAGKSIEETVSLRDVAATVMDLTNLGSKSTFPGRSLARYWRSSPEPSDAASGAVFSELKYAGGFPQWFPIARGDVQSLVANGYHYIKNGDSREELYDWLEDPWEQNDLSGTEEGRNKVIQFGIWLESFVRGKESPS